MAKYYDSIVRSVCVVLDASLLENIIKTIHATSLCLTKTLIW